MRPIDADALKEDLKELELRCRKMLWSGSELYVEALAVVKSMIDSAPSITTPPNDPLTLDELRDMDGEPFYYFSLVSAHGEYAILRVISEECFAQSGGSNKCCVNIKKYGINWLAYRRKPEDVET